VVSPLKRLSKEFDNFHTYKPVWREDRVYKGNLRAGHSILVPALHFALLSHPEKILLHGVQLRDHKHWTEHKNNNNDRFPSRMIILTQIRLLKEIFKIKVCCTDAESLPVEMKVLEYVSPEWYKAYNSW
jgi:hypothetical protein